MRNFLEIKDEKYYGEFKALLDSECYPGITYKNLKLDVDLNMANKVARLSQIKMSMVKEDITLKLYLKIVDGDGGAAVANQ